MRNTDTLGTGKISKLIFGLGWPTAINFIVLTAYSFTDAVFVGHWLGTGPLAAVVVAGTAIFVFCSFGLAIGIGGASIIARAFGEKNKDKAASVFGNQNILVIVISLLLLVVGYFFEDTILELVGAKEQVLQYAKPYYRVMLAGVPFTSWSTMANNVIHTEGKAKRAMWNSIVPTILNILLNPFFIVVCQMGIGGSAWATFCANVVGFIMTFHFFYSGKSQLNCHGDFIKIKTKQMWEIAKIGGSVLVNLFAPQLVIIILNRLLYKYEGEAGLVIYGIASRINLIFMIPIIAIDGGMRPIIGFNVGSKQTERVYEAIKSGIGYGLTIGYTIFLLICLFSDYIVRFFIDDTDIVIKTSLALNIVFSFFPLLIVQIATTTYLMAISKPNVSFVLVLIKNLAFPVPMLYVLSYYFGYKGLLYTFPIVDIAATVISLFILRRNLRQAGGRDQLLFGIE
jgi:putative MATE family efflux protein